MARTLKRRERKRKTLKRLSNKHRVTRKKGGKGGIIQPSFSPMFDPEHIMYNPKTTITGEQRKKENEKAKRKKKETYNKEVVKRIQSIMDDSHTSRELKELLINMITHALAGSHSQIVKELNEYPDVITQIYPSHTTKSTDYSQGSSANSPTLTNDSLVSSEREVTDIDSSVPEQDSDSPE
jgi:hypothetical protein